MTRDKAIELRGQMYGGSEEARNRLAARDVDNFVALGILRLEPPAGPEAQFLDVLKSAGIEGIQRRAVIDGIYSAGLVIDWK